MGKEKKKLKIRFVFPPDATPEEREQALFEVFDLLLSAGATPKNENNADV